MPPPRKQEIVVSGHLAWLSEKLGIPPWGQILIAAVVAVTISAGTTLWSFNGRMSKMEGQLGVLVAGRRIDDASRFGKLGDTKRASEAAQEAKALLATAIKKRTPAPPEYFEDSINALNNANAAGSGLAEDFQGVRIALAEYRSALMTSPDIDPDLRKIPLGPGNITPDMVGQRAVYQFNSSRFFLEPKASIISEGAVFNGSEIPDRSSLFNPKTRSIAINQNSITGLIIIARNQVLDGIVWKNVTFVNTHVIYEGGDLDLENVKFVNCTFEAPPSKHGEQLVQYAALLESSLVV